MKKVLVTGGAGFVGRHMVDALIRRGLEPRIIDNFSTSSPAALADVARKIDLIKGDIRSSADVKKAVKGMDAVFHFAAIRSVVKTVEDPLLNHEVNATGSLLLLHHAQSAGAKHFIFTSSSAVYGDAAADRQREDGRLSPISPYGAAKLASEHYALYYFRQRGLPTTSVRIFNVYGPRQNPESKYSLAVPGVSSRILKGQPPVIDGSGEQARDFVYIGDVIDAFFLILGNPKSYGQVYNLGSGTAVSVNTLVNTLLRLAGSKLEPIHGPRRPGDPERTCADISRIRRQLGWKPQVPLEEGLEAALDWARSHPLK